MLLLKALLVWLIMMVLAILNGALRVKVINLFVGEYSGHILSSLLLSLIIFITSYIFVSVFKISISKELLLVGIFWFILTIIFEFGFGHYIMNHPWEKLLADYNFFKGRLWILVLISELLAPIICGKIKY